MHACIKVNQERFPNMLFSSKTTFIAFAFFTLVSIPQVCLGEESGQIDINSATIEELARVFGIDEKQAQAIIKGRPYNNLEDIFSNSGLDSDLLQEIIDLVLSQSTEINKDQGDGKQWEKDKEERKRQEERRKEAMKREKEREKELKIQKKERNKKADKQREKKMERDNHERQDEYGPSSPDSAPDSTTGENTPISEPKWL